MKNGKSVIVSYFAVGDTVKIKELTVGSRTYIGLRAPRLDDRGTVTEITSADGVQTSISVQMVEGDSLIWEAAFEPSELEVIPVDLSKFQGQGFDPGANW